MDLVEEVAAICLAYARGCNIVPLVSYSRGRSTVISACEAKDDGNGGMLEGKLFAKIIVSGLKVDLKYYSYCDFPEFLSEGLGI